jgi:hypothetical protein
MSGEKLWHHFWFQGVKRLLVSEEVGNSNELIRNIAIT